MSFSNILKTAQEANTLAATPAVASVMTLELTPENSIAAYSGDDYIRNDVKYKWFDNFVDDRYSTVDINKNISVDPSQVNISQERNSQFIPFKIPRYWDGIDLTEMTFWIHYENKEGCGDKPPVNFQYNSESILFGWLVDLDVTYLPGDVKFEIQAIGQIKSSDNTVFDYTWKTMPNGKLNIIESLTHSCKPIEPDSNWNTEVLTQMSSMVSKAEQAVIDANAAADRAEKAAEEASKIAITDEDKAAIAEQAKASTLEEVAITYATKEETGNLEQNIANTYATKEELGTTNRSVEEVAKDLADNHYTKDDIDDKLGNIDISTQLTDITTRVGNVETDFSTYKETTNADLQAIHDAIDTLPSTLESDYYKSETVDTLLAEKANKTDLDAKANQTDLNAVKSTADANKTNVDALSTKVAELNDAVANVDTSPRLTYDVKYNDTEDADVGENVFAFYEITNEGQEDEVREIKQKFTIVGGSGGSSTSSSLKIGYVTKTPLVVTVDDKALITFTFSGTDSSGDEVLEAQATWKVAGEVVATSIVVSGENTFDVTDFLNIGTQKVQLSVTDDAGSLVTKNWTVQKIDVRIESTFNDAYSYGIGDVSFNYTPYGAISKDIHFVLDEKEIGKVTTSTSGIPMSYTLPSQEHGSHLLEVYITADINNDTIESNHIFKDIIWKDDTSTIPVIGCATRSINITQYNTVNIKYTVIDPKTETPEVTWFVNDEIISTEVLSEKDKDGYYTFSYKASNSGTFALKVTCGEAEPKVITVVVEELNIDVAPVTAGLAFDFNPVGYSNNSADRLWSYNDVTMTVSDNFDWVNGGYQLDENGDQYFCVKAGTNAVINYNLFADDPKKNGKEFKTIFRTKNIRKRDTSFLSCMDGNIGLDMKVEQATVYDSGGSFRSPYCEDTIIEYEFNINKDSDMMIAMSYEDGTPSIPYEYKETSSYKQSNAQPIIIGSPDCDVHIYRMKAYSLSLTDTDIKNNFIADARNADEMLARYNRNQIYNDNGVLISTSANGGFNVDALMKAAPDLRYIFLEVPQFTNDKDNKIDGCTVYWRYPNGTRPEDNWTCTGMRHRGQGTSSNLYGYAGRNIDLCMDRDESLFTWVDADGKTVESSTITLSDTSFPTDYLNIKVNIASSENANNAELARRFNEYQPFLRYARKKDSRVKDTMEFYNCVVFIRETSTDPSVPHREFSDNNWHKIA